MSSNDFCFCRAVKHGTVKLGLGDEVELQVDFSSIWGGRHFGGAVLVAEDGIESRTVYVRDIGGGWGTNGPTGCSARVLLTGPVTLRVTYGVHETDAARRHHYGTEVHEWRLEPTPARAAADRARLEKLEAGRQRTIEALVGRKPHQGLEVVDDHNVVIGRRPLGLGEAEVRLEAVRDDAVRHLLREGRARWSPRPEKVAEIRAGATWLRYGGHREDGSTILVPTTA